jgi:serine/threonine-protein kinase
MPNESLVNQILEDLLNSHRTPEEACSGDPELLREVRGRWERIQLVGHRISALFPSESLTKRQATALTDIDANLPVIEGYEVTEILGRGGMGIVFKARHLKLNRFVAMKMLLGGNHAGPPEIARFRREAEAVAALRHPNIVQVHDVGEVSSGPFFTMEFVEGGSLARRSTT